MYHSHGMFGQSTTVVHLNAIQNTCGVHLSVSHYNQLLGLPAPAIAVLHTRAHLLRDFLHHHAVLFPQLILLSPTNMELFFQRATFGFFGNAHTVLTNLSAAQNRASTTVVVVPAAPVYASPTFFAPSVHVHNHGHVPPSHHHHGHNPHDSMHHHAGPSYGGHHHHH